MTREEAIRVIKDHIDTYVVCHGEEDTVAVSIDNVDVEALDMAIKALSAEPCEESAREWCKQNGYVMMPEAVYEQDITKAYFEGQNIEPCEDAISRQAVLDVTERELFMGDAISKIEKLPPVTPEQKMGHWISLGVQGEVDGQIVRAFTCSECGAISIFRLSCGNIVNGDLCPNCMAKMEVAENG